MDFNAAHEDDVFLFDPTVADDVAELACLDDLDLDWSDPPSSLGLGDDADMQEPHLEAHGPAAGLVDGVTDVAEIDPLPWSAGSVERQPTPTALRTTCTTSAGTFGTITSSTNRTVKRASNTHCVPTTTDKLDGNTTETRNTEKSFLGFGRKKEHPKTVDLPSPSSKVPSAVVSNVHATGKSSPKAKVFPDPVRSEGKPVFSAINVVGNSSLDKAAIKSGGFPLPPSASSSEGSVSGDASTGGGSSTGPPPTAEEAAAEARRRRAQRRDILDQKRRARRQKRQHQHSPPSTTSSSGASLTGREAAPPASATEVAAIAQKLLVNASPPPPRPAPAVVIPPSGASTSPSPSAETLQTRASSRFAGATSAPSATGIRPAKPTPSVPPAPKAKRAPTKSKPMSPPSTITFKKESSPTEGVLSSSSFLLADEDVTELTEDMLPKGTDPESRKQRRLIRNRLSAALHRKRKRETLDNQKKMIEDRDDAIADLRGQLEKMTARCKSLETDLGVIMRCYGASQINRILEESRSGVIPRGDAMVTDSPPHLVNISSSSSGGSGSDRSTCSEDTPSPPPSPTHHSSLGESDEEKQPGTTTNLAASRKGNNNNKRKRAVLTGLGFYPAVATVAMCGLLGCMMLPPSVLRNPEQEVEPPSSSSVAVNPHAEGGEGRRRRLQAVFPSEDDEEEKAISRWSNLESKWPGLDPDQLLGGGGEGGDSKRHPPSSSWVISPIEMYPSLWTVDERISKTPWTVERSIQLFDFRSSKISPPSGSAANGAAEGSSVLPLRLFPDAYPLKAPPARESKTSSSAARMLRGGAVVGTTVVTDQTEASNNEGDGNMDYEYVDAEDADMDSAESSAGDGVIGSSFMFCPAASAVFSPGLLQLAGISGDTTGSGKDGQGRTDDAASRWQWDGTFSDDDPDGDILHSGATHPSPYPVTTLNSLIGSPVVGGDDPAFDDYYRPGSRTANGDDALSDESKALVPTYLDYYRKKLLTTFSASSSEFSSHGRGGNGGGVPIIKTVLGGDDPYMTILVPASAISGGGAATDFSESRSSPRWLELGCQVLSARVVDGVNFVGDPTPLRHHEHEDEDEE